MIPQQRTYTVSEPEAEYLEGLESLLDTIPMPVLDS